MTETYAWLLIALTFSIAAALYYYSYRVHMKIFLMPIASYYGINLDKLMGISSLYSWERVKSGRKPSRVHFASVFLPVFLESMSQADRIEFSQPTQKQKLSDRMVVFAIVLIAGIFWVAAYSFVFSGLIGFVWLASMGEWKVLIISTGILLGGPLIVGLFAFPSSFFLRVLMKSKQKELCLRQLGCQFLIKLNLYLAVLVFTVLAYGLVVFSQYGAIDSPPHLLMAYSVVAWPIYYISKKKHGDFETEAPIWPLIMFPLIALVMFYYKADFISVLYAEIFYALFLLIMLLVPYRIGASKN